MIKIACLSDQHGFLPDTPPADFLLISGDISPVYDHSVSFQQQWFNGMFLPWLKKQPARYKCFCFGNHDFYGEKLTPDYLNGQLNHPMIVPKSNIYYLHNTSIILDGIKIWGSSYSLRFYDWSFNIDEPDFAKVVDKIPSDTDIIITHGPPYGYGDWVYATEKEEEWPGKKHVGSPSLTKKIGEIQPRLTVYGHVHQGYGQYKIGNSLLLNSSYVGQDYKPKNKIWEIEL